MPSNSFGELFRATTFGESHGPALGVVIDGAPAGMRLDLEGIRGELRRRRPGTGGAASSAREETDEVEVLSGLSGGETTGAPLCLVVRNRDARSGDYEGLKETFRPGHGDYAWWKKFGVRDWRGGGRLSGRETVGRVIAGAVARQLLAPEGIGIFGHTVEAASIRARRFDRGEIERNELRCADAEAARRMVERIAAIRAAGDSAGGVVEVVAEGVPAGLGDPVFDKLDARLAAAMLSIGGVKGVEFGEGFGLAGMRGSEANDPLGPSGAGANRAGGIQGGISNGRPVTLRIAVKPPSSIALPQESVTLEGEPVVITVGGRHDACLCPRVVPVAEAMAALVLADAYLRQRALGAAPARRAAEGRET